MTRKTKKIISIWFWRIVIIFIVCLLVAITGNQQSILVNQSDDAVRDKDILDKLNEISVVVEPEDKFVLVPEPDPNALSDAERDLVERVVAAEARGESIEGQAAVAQVIRDRAYTWDMTITEVCLAKGQFAKPYQGEISIKTWIAVSKVFDGGVSVLEVPTTHFASNNPYWAEGKVNRGSIGRHTFWY
jgi:spore germination cell wall hydrolase CwlJ-like protein